MKGLYAASWKSSTKDEVASDQHFVTAKVSENRLGRHLMAFQDIVVVPYISILHPN